MFPSAIMNNSLNRNVANHKFVRQGNARLAFLKGILYSSYCGFRESCMGVISSSSAAALGYHVICIILLCPDKEMIRVYAKPIITFMKHAKTIRNWAIFQNPSIAMRRIICLFFMSASGKLSVATGILWSSFSTCPYPASIRFMDLVPKLFFIRFLSGCIRIVTSPAAKFSSSSQQSANIDEERLSAIYAVYKDRFFGLLSFLGDCNVFGRHMNLLSRFMCSGRNGVPAPLRPFCF